MLKRPRAEKVHHLEVLERPRADKERLLKLIHRLLKTLEGSKGQKEAGCSAQSAEGTATWEILGQGPLRATRQALPQGSRCKKRLATQVGLLGEHLNIKLDNNSWSHRNGRKARHTGDPWAGCSSRRSGRHCAGDRDLPWIGR